MINYVCVCTYSVMWVRNRNSQRLRGLMRGWPAEARLWLNLYAAVSWSPKLLLLLSAVTDLLPEMTILDLLYNTIDMYGSSSPTLSAWLCISARVSVLDIR